MEGMEVELAGTDDAAAGVEEQVESVVEETTEEQVEGEQPEISEEAGEEKSEEEQSAEAKEDAELLKQLSERGIPPKYKDLLKKDPFLRNSVMGYKAFRSEFPNGIKEAREYKQTLEEFGGREGIEAIKSDAAATAELDQMFAEGNPKAIEAIVETSREGFVKMMPTALEKFREVDPEMYSHVLGRVVFNTIKDSPIVDAYNALVKAGDNDTAKVLAEYYNSIKALADRQPEKKVDPKVKELESRIKEQEEKETQGFIRDISTEMKSHNSKALDSELAKQFKAAGKDYEAFKKKAPETVVEMLNACNSRLLKEMEKDAKFVEHHNSLIQSKNRDKVLSITQQRVQKLSPEVAKRVYRLFNAPGTIAPPKKTAAGSPAGKPSAPGTVRLSKPPDASKVDRRRTSDDMIFNNEAYLIGRKEKYVWA